MTEKEGGVREKETKSVGWYTDDHKGVALTFLISYHKLITSFSFKDRP